MKSNYNPFDKAPQNNIDLGEQQKEGRGSFDRAPKGSQNPVHTLVLEGGGAKGISYAAALPFFDLTEFSRVVGSSAGAFTAAMIATGVPMHAIRETAMRPMSDILEPDALKQFGGNWEETYGFKMLIPYDWEGTSSSTHLIRNIIGQQIAARYENLDKLLDKLLNDIEHNYEKIDQGLGVKIDVEAFKGIEQTDRTLSIVELQGILNTVRNNINTYTFEQHDQMKKLWKKLHTEVGMKDLMVTATRLTQPEDNKLEGYLKVFDSSDEQDRQYGVLDAVIASGAFPGVYAAVEIQGTLYADGGIINNNPGDIAVDRIKGKEEGSILCLHLNKYDDDFKKRKIDLESSATRKVIEKAIEKGSGFVFETNENNRQEYRAQKYRKVREYYDEMRYMEIEIVPGGINTLTAQVSDQQRQEIDQEIGCRAKVGWENWQKLKKGRREYDQFNSVAFQPSQYRKTIKFSDPKVKCPKPLSPFWEALAAKA